MAMPGARAIVLFKRWGGFEAETRMTPKSDHLLLSFVRRDARKKSLAASLFSKNNFLWPRARGKKEGAWTVSRRAFALAAVHAALCVLTARRAGTVRTKISRPNR